MGSIRLLRRKFCVFGNGLPSIRIKVHVLFGPEVDLCSYVPSFIDIYFHNKWIWFHIILWFDKSIFHLLGRFLLLLLVFLLYCNKNSLLPRLDQTFFPLRSLSTTPILFVDHTATEHNMREINKHLWIQSFNFCLVHYIHPEWLGRWTHKQAHSQRAHTYIKKIWFLSSINHTTHKLHMRDAKIIYKNDLSLSFAFGQTNQKSNSYPLTSIILVFSYSLSGCILFFSSFFSLCVWVCFFLFIFLDIVFTHIQTKEKVARFHFLTYWDWNKSCFIPNFFFFFATQKNQMSNSF